MFWKNSRYYFCNARRRKNFPQPQKCQQYFIHEKLDKILQNYGPISLLYVVYKHFTEVIGSRIGDSENFQQPREQIWYRERYSTMAHIHDVNQGVEKSAEYTKPLYTAFIDYKNAFYFELTAA